MSDGSILEARERLEKAVAGLAQQLEQLDTRLAARLSAPPPTDDALLARHDNLKADIALVIAELDDMLSTPAESKQTHG
jgi:hypothetical protein